MVDSGEKNAFTPPPPGAQRDFRVDGLCLRHFAERTGVAAGEKPPAHGAAASLIQLDAWLKTGPTSEGLRCDVFDGRCCPFVPVVPHYDRETRVLSVGKLSVLTYSRTAWSQIAVLELFQAQGWPSTIVDPLGKTHDPQYGTRLRNVVFRLNHNQRPLLIRFHCHEIERTISWELEIR